MKKNIFLFLLSLSLVGCASKKDVLYFQDIAEEGIPQPILEYQYPEIQINDILKIDVTAMSEEAIAPYRFEKAPMQSNQQLAILKLEGYVVDAKGNIHYPGLGKIYAAGLTTNEFQAKIEKLLSSKIKDASVKVRLLNFKITVLGEVNQPGTITLTEERITLPQALGMAGDLTIRGKRENILLIRTIDGKRKTVRIDMTQTNWMDSPYYYLKQNDIIYVSPNGSRVTNAGFIGSIGSLLSVASILLSAVVLIAK